MPRILYTDKYEVDIGLHVFPTRKYRWIKERLIHQHGLGPGDFVEPRPATDAEILTVHTPEYVESLKTGRLSIEEQMRMELPQSPELVQAAWLCCGATIQAARWALEDGVGLHIGGGFHHAFPDHGEGFCVLNDIAVAIRVLQHEGAIHRAAVIDCDVHHGNGTAVIFHQDPSVYTFSIHQENNYPAVKPPSSWDIGLEDEAGDEAFLGALREAVPKVLEAFKPDLVMYVAGADPYIEDQLGGLAITLEGLKARDELVIGEARARRIPIVPLLAGGYAVNPQDTVTIHGHTILEGLRYLKSSVSAR